GRTRVPATRSYFGSSRTLSKCSVEKRNDSGRRRPSASSTGSDTTVPTAWWFSSAVCKAHSSLYVSFEFSGLPSFAETTSVSGFEPPLRSTYSSPSRSSRSGLKYSIRLGSVSSRVTPAPRAALATTTPAESGTNRRAQKRRPGLASVTTLSAGADQTRNDGYITHAQISAM